MAPQSNLLGKRHGGGYVPTGGQQQNYQARYDDYTRYNNAINKVVTTSQKNSSIIQREDTISGKKTGTTQQNYQQEPKKHGGGYIPFGSKST